MLPDQYPHRVQWINFPDVVICATESAVKNNPDYEQAKQGNVQDAAPSAKRLAIAMLGPDSLDAIKQLPIEGALLLPVHALEGQGLNRIPAAFAELLGQRLALDVEAAVVQANVVNYTGASGWQRLASPPLFEGEVAGGRRYILVDDFVGQGSTLANLRGYVTHLGGDVVGAVCLTGRGDSAKLALRLQTLESLREKHGPEIEAWWLKSCGYDFACLTESEARYLLHAENADTSEIALLKRDLKETIEIAKKTM